MRTSQVCGPVWRQSKSALKAAPPSTTPSSFAAIGASQLDGNDKSASRRKNGGRTRVTIDRALMPGSKTPSPPAFQIHAWPGCQRRTSSRQTTSTDFSFRAEAHARAGSTPAAWRECQVANRLSFFSAARSARLVTSLTVAPGGFSSSTCLPASRACRAMSCRICGGVQTATASISGWAASMASTVG